ncbi:MAG: FHA domain-containing protein [Oscillospiraceae bacterium]|jgi:pSer/pThr/pTyr-binding forkhead associated (FHA) protein|nr:FHA domain-containing protein [Oscillospiraceae bacterium]
MSEKNRKPAAALVLGIMILIAAAAFAALAWAYADESWRQYALWALAIVIAVWLLYEIRTIIRYARASRDVGSYKLSKSSASALVLMNEDGTGIQSWDLRNETGLVIGRSHDGSDVDIDLSGTEYFSFVSKQHAVLNFTVGGWMLTDVGSQNGTALLRQGSSQKLLLAPGEPVPIRVGDTIYLADETILAVR